MDRRPKDLPIELWNKERELVHLRRTGQEASSSAALSKDNVVGLALSGGGIRSATISLGVLQALAKHGQLRFIDYLSSVSGGGYVSGFLGGLFVRDHGGPERQDEWTRVEEQLKQPKAFPVDWLRENGRFLAPNGAGDLALAFAVVARNMIAVQLVLAVLFLTVLLIVNGLRRAITRASEDLPGHLDGAASQLFAGLNAQGSHLLVRESFWLSPVMFAVMLCFVLWVLPTGVAYWLVPSDERDGTGEGRRYWPQTLTLAGLAAGGVAGVAVPAVHAAVPVWLSAVAVTLAALTAITLTLSLTRRKNGEVPGAVARNWLTTALRNALLVTGGLLLFALIDSLAQTLYVRYLVDHDPIAVLKWIGGGFSGLAALATLLQRSAGVLGAATKDRLKLPLEVIAAVAGLTLLSIMLISLATFGHALTWDAGTLPRSEVKRPELVYQVKSPIGETFRVEKPDPTEHVCRVGEETVLCTPGELDPKRYGISLLVLVLLTAAFCQTYSFVNRSSLAALYGARLARAYLGASNAARRNPQNQSLTRLLPGDDLDLEKYKPHQHGGPLPIINVTLNETVAGRSQVEQRDRKGMNMAVGPAGISVGVNHHAEWRSGTAKGASDAPNSGRELWPTVHPADGFRVFPKGEAVKPYWPTVGRWMAISGAAVSTGLGSRTSLGLSLLIGLLNFRLGHWWRSGVDPRKRDKSSTSESASWLAGLALWLARKLSVQMHLLNELFARFPGTSTEDWYLTDGGHFENTAAYELIRRRLPFIIVCDNGADVERSFDDLGNLVRQARTDFGAHIEFLDEAALAATKQPDVIGSLAQLGFCGRLADALAAGQGGAPANPPPAAAEERRATRYAALARISYDDGGPDSMLLLLRPAVLGREPLDVLNYQVANPTFPQQSTGDQFFDEAQWEAYRRLGEFMACHVFKKLSEPGSDPALGWSPISNHAIAEMAKGCASASA